MRVENSIAMNDYMSATLRDIIRTMNMMISNMATLDSNARVIGQGGFDAMRQSITAAEVSLQQLEQQLMSVDMAQQRAGGQTSSWGMKFMGLYSIVGLIKGAFDSIGRAMTFVDGFSTANARLGLDNDGLQTQVELQDKVAESANRARASYQATANLVTNIGMTGAMGTTEEAIGFAEKVNKLLVIGGGGAQQNQASLLQLSQSLASGKMQGDEYRSLRENAPALMATIAEGMGVQMGDLKKMSTAGELTSEAIIQSLGKMGVEIDKQFAAMPVTFGQNMQMMQDTFGRWGADMAKDGGLRKINDLFAELNVWLQSTDGQAFLQGISDGLYAIAYLIELVVDGFQWFGDAMDALGPVGDAILYGLLAAGIVFVTLYLIQLGNEAIAAGIKFLVALGPVGWIILAIGAAIGVVIALLLNFGFTANDILTMVGGLFGGLFAFIGNILVLLNNALVDFVEFFANLFIDPVYAVKKLFYDLTNDVATFFWGMINGIIDGINWVILAVNTIKGTKFDTIETFKYEPMKPPTSDKDVVNLDKYRLDYLDYKDFAGKGADLATGFLKKMGENDDPLGIEGSGFMGNGGNIDTVNKVGKIEGEVDISKEDIKYLLDSTTQKYVNQVNLSVQTEAPIIHNNGTVREEADINKVATALTEKILEKKVIADENI